MIGLVDRIRASRGYAAATRRLRPQGRPAEALLVRMQRDVERLKLAITTMAEPTRALTLLATGDRIFVDPRDTGTGFILAHEGRIEEDELRILRSHLKPGSVVLDVGANYGYYALCVAPFVRPNGRVFAFEPNPHVFAMLRSSVRLNGYDDVVTAARIAVSDEAGTLTYAVDETEPGGGHLEDPAQPAPAHWQRTEVPVRALDEELPADLVADVIKIDVEGHEERALRGLRRLIARSPAVMIFMEFIHDFHAGDGRFERLVHLIGQELGLRMHRVLTNGRTVPVEPADLVGASCTLILCRQPVAPAPDLTMFPGQMQLDAGARLLNGGLVWQRAAAHGGTRCTIGWGGDLFLPRGRFRMVVHGRFDGPFLLRLLADGDTLWEGRVTGGPVTRNLTVVVDALRLQTVVIALAGRSKAVELERIEFWRH